jgi:tetratricopeptide (TPR) repeat protein
MGHFVLIRDRQRATRRWLPAAILPLAAFALMASSRSKADDGAAVASDSSPVPVLMPLPPIGPVPNPVPAAPGGAATSTASDDNISSRRQASSTTSRETAPANPSSTAGPMVLQPAASPPVVPALAVPAPPVAAPPVAAPIIPTPIVVMPSVATPSALPSSSTASDPFAASAQTPAQPIITQPAAVQPITAQPSTTGDTKPSTTPPAIVHADAEPIIDWSFPEELNSGSQLTPADGVHTVTPASAAIADATSAATPPDIGSGSSDDLPEMRPLEVEVAQFKEIRPGVTTSEELIQKWGEGKLQRKKDGQTRRIYKLGSYQEVAVLLEHGRVAAINVRFDSPIESTALAERFHLDPDSSVPVNDDGGQALGISYPDRGTLFSFDGGTKLVSQMLLEPIDPQPFLLRAVHEVDYHPGWSLRDVDYALKLEPTHAESHDMRAQILLGIGRPEDALKSVNRAVGLAPANPAMILTKAAVLSRLDNGEEAVQLTKSVAERPDLSGLLKAHALCQLAELTAGAGGQDKRAVELYLAAIKVAQPLAADDRVAIRRLAKQVLLDAHLGAANDIAWGVWQKKSITVARWINQANDLAQDLINHEQADPELGLQVAHMAVAASDGTEGKWDAAEWIRQALDTGRKLIADVDDPLRKQQLEWEVGTALVDALEVQRTAGLNAQSLAHAMSVLRYLQSGIQYRQRTSETMYILGRAYFQIGLIHAVVEHDHATAALWFDHAVPLLDRPLPSWAGSRIGRNGEMLVSMGISYWQTGNHEEALRLTQQGTTLMAKAVAMKLLNDGALAVPYGNLAAMYRQMGHSQEARAYAEMAAKHDTLHR